MQQSTMHRRSMRPFLSAGLGWILLWVLPWGYLLPSPDHLYLQFLMDMLKLGLALILFILPGYWLFVLLQGDELQEQDWKDLAPLGFAYSIFLIAIVGLIGRIAGLSFVVVRTVFALIGLAELVLLAVYRSDAVIPKKRFGTALQHLLRNSPLVMALIFSFLLSMHGELFFIDDTSYGAYLTNWQFSEELGFKNIIHHFDVMENTRFWLSMYPMGQALLADRSGISGLLLLSNYLELFLAPLAVLVLYWFLRELGLSPRMSGFSALIQVCLYAWMIGNEWPVGTWFYESLAEDKVSVVFFLAPVFFILVFRFIRQPGWNNRLLVMMLGIAIVLTHPVMLFFSCCIAGAFTFLSWVTKRSSFRQLLEIGALCILLMFPYAVIRLSDTTGELSGPYLGSQATSSFQIDQYANIVNDLFYGLNPEVLMFVDFSSSGQLYSFYQYIRMLPLALLIVGALVALRRLHLGALYGYLLSASVLVLFATLPYTGWILGYFVSARLLSRVSWFAPFGLIVVVLVKAVIDKYSGSRARSEQENEKAGKRAVLWGLMVCFLFVSPFLTFSLVGRLPEYFAKLEHNRQLAQLGAYIDEHTSGTTTVIALNYTDLQKLPSASAHADLISFREELEYNGHNNFLPIEEVQARIAASTSIRSLESSGEKCPHIHDYKLQYVLVPEPNVEQYMASLTPCDLSIQIAYRTRQFVLLEFK